MMFTSCLYLYQLNDREQYENDEPMPAGYVRQGSGNRHSLISYNSMDRTSVEGRKPAVLSGSAFVVDAASSDILLFDCTSSSSLEGMQNPIISNRPFADL
jgi:hypothetical protein